MHRVIVRAEKRAIMFASVALIAAIAGHSAQAAILQANTSHNVAYNQTGAGMVSLAGAFFSANILTSPGDTTAFGSLTYPGSGSPQALAQVGPNDIGFQTGLLADQTALDTAYPLGAYVFTLGSGPGSETFTSTIPATIYPGQVPQIANYAAFTTFNPQQAFTLNLTGGFTPQGSESFTFFSIFNTTTNSYVYNQGFLAPTTTSFLIGANTLVAGDSYQFEAIFDNRFSNVGGAGPASFNLFDTRTFGGFTLSPAAAPEPATWGLLLAGFGAVGVTFRRARSAQRRSTIRLSA